VGAIVTASNGALVISDADDLENSLSAIIASPIVGTNVEISVHAKNATFYSENGEMTKSTIAFKTFGSLMRHQDFILGFQPVNEEDIESATFQICVKSTNSSGHRIMRLFERRLAVSSDRKQVERSADLSVPALEVIRRAAAMARNNDIRSARVLLISGLRMLQRGMRSRESQKSYINYVVQSERLDGFLREIEALQKQNVKSKADDYIARNIHRSENLSSTDFKIAA
jgi:hypothetical protein